MARRFKDMQTQEQQYAAKQAQAQQLREAARNAEAEVHELTAPRRREMGGGRALPEFGPHSDRDQARADQLRATARDLRAAADAADEDSQPKQQKRRWFR